MKARQECDADDQEEDEKQITNDSTEEARTTQSVMIKQNKEYEDVCNKLRLYCSVDTSEDEDVKAVILPQVKKTWEKPRVLRRVSFADSLGQDLASIRIMTEGRDTPPNLEGFHGIPKLNQEKKTAEETFEPLFLQPIKDFDKYNKTLAVNSVALESTAIVGNTINGVVKVRNIAYEKSVFLHYTTDNWISKKQLPCFYVNCFNSSESAVFDTFAFQLEIDTSWDHVEFCVEFSCCGQSYWDNHDCKNFRLERKSQAI